MKRAEFLNSLNQKLESINKSIQTFEKASIEELSARKAAEKWNVLECIEHLIRYNDFYLTEFEKSLKRSRLSSDQSMKRGSFGQKSAASMLPGQNGGIKPMRTFRSKNTLGANLDQSVFSKFKKQQNELQRIIENAEDRDIGSVKCKTTLPLIKFRFPDALEFVINHQVRHIIQAETALKNANEKVEN